MQISCYYCLGEAKEEKGGNGKGGEDRGKARVERLERTVVKVENRERGC